MALGSSRITNVRALEVFDSKGTPTLQVRVITSGGEYVASVPSGVSTGEHEAVELRDGGQRLRGKGVQRAVERIHAVIAPELRGKSADNHAAIEEILLALDNTEQKSNLGANSMLGVSMAVARAGAASRGIALWQHVADIAGQKQLIIPTPSVLCIEGGLHGGNQLQVQEFMVQPRADTFRAKFEKAVDVYHALGSILEGKFGAGATNVGLEGAFAAPIATTEEALDLLVAAIEQSGHKDTVTIGLDVAASTFYKDKQYLFEGKAVLRDALVDWYMQLLQKYPISSIEDPFAEEDWEGFTALTNRAPDSLMVVGDDLLVTNIARVEHGVNQAAGNTLLVKPNQVGTIGEAVRAANYARDHGWKLMASHRSGDTCDSFISDFAVGAAAHYIKAGAPTRGERVAKYNRLLAIEEEIIV